MTSISDQQPPGIARIAPAPPGPSALTADELDELGGRIPFGDRDNQTMPPSWAAGMLRIMAERDPETFGAYMLEVITGHRAVKRGRPARGAAEGAE
jgi:hypothetical protein